MAELFETHTGSNWRPRAGSIVNRRTLTAAMIDSGDFLAARRRAGTEVLLPPGRKVAFADGSECNDHAAIWAALDRVHGKHPSMVLLHGGSPKGAERIAACWADSRKVPQIAFKPAQERCTIQAQRPAAGNAADRRRRLPQLRNQRQPGRPGQGARHPLFDFRKGGGA